MNHNKRKRIFWILIMAYAVILCNMQTIYAWSSQIVPIVQNKVNYKENAKIMPVGAAIGIYIKMDGLLALGTAEIIGADGKNHHPSKNKIKAGDYILEINQHELNNIDDLKEQINKSKGKEIKLKLRRNDDIIFAVIKPVRLCDQNYGIGVWVRDDLQGIGTLSFIDKNNNFAALGHNIVDLDTEKSVHIKSGYLFNAYVVDLIKGEIGTAGEIIGSIMYNKKNLLGDIYINKAVGIYGKIKKDSIYQYDDSKAIPVASKDEIKIGPAKIMCQIDDKINTYDIQITSINRNTDHAYKNMIIEVTDEKMLAKTSGIVQGMSGSPIIQNGKIVGAVTHVFVNNPTRGYGIFIEEMIQ